ncbi:MAG: plasmid pRiA4b ORF-3 family protein [Bacteroidales bacterium]|nr:plasmid pRiA4b ORF-3 family protein [Bacteroidales bacterium]
MTYQFKIQLKNVSNPTVWRRILVPAHYTFEEFHKVIQIAFGWEFAHLYFFSPTGYNSQPMIEMNYEGDDFFETLDEDSLDSETTLLSDIFVTEKQKFTYLYDTGDDWMHQINLEKILPDNEIEKPVLLKGQGACPPEDCGGPWGYEELKETLANKKHPDHKEMKEWLGMRPKDNWDAAAFDLEAHQQGINLYC